MTTASQSLPARTGVGRARLLAGGLLFIAGPILTLRRYLVPGRGRTLATVGAALAAVGLAFNSLSPGEQRLQPIDPGHGLGGVTTGTVARRLSIVSGFFAYLQARGDIAASPVPRAYRPGESDRVRGRACR